MNDTPISNSQFAPPLERLLTTQEAADLLGVSPAFLANLRVKGDGPHFFKLGHAVRYSRETLFEWAAERERRSTSG